MSKSRLKMRQIREILRYRFENGVSFNKISDALKISKGSVVNTVKRFEESKLSWPLSDELSDSDLEHQLYPPEKSKSFNEHYPTISYLEKEMKRPHVTLQLLYEEYAKDNPNGLKRTAFYDYYNKSFPNRPVTMKMIHKGGDKLFIDYSGDSISYVNRTTGEVISTELFVCCWGASSYCYAEATESQKQEEFTMSHVRAMGYFGCVPNVFVPDNLKSAVVKAKRFDPTINRLYAEMAEHYNVVVLPARVRKPQDKGVVESNVLHIQRFILARLRNYTFFSLDELNASIKKLLEEFNHRPMKEYGNQHRRKRFEELDLPHANQLPENPFTITKIATKVLVGFNYHIRFENHNYSVPSKLVKKRVEVYQRGNIIEIYHDGIHICRHLKGLPNFGHTTNRDHMPSTHKFIANRSVEWFIAKGNEIDQDVGEFLRLLMMDRHHPEQAFNAAQGVLRLVKVYGEQRLHNACRRAIYFKSVSFKSVQSILEKGLDKQDWGEGVLENEEQNIEHENLRNNSDFSSLKEEQCI